MKNSPSRCDALRSCCLVTVPCERKQKHTTISTMMAIQKTTVDMLLNGCRSEMSSRAANVTTYDHAMANKVTDATTAILALIKDYDGTVSDTQPEPKSPTITRSKFSQTKAEALSNTILSMLQEESKGGSRVASDWVPYRRRGESAAHPHNRSASSHRAQMHGVAHYPRRLSGSVRLPYRRLPLMQAIDNDSKGFDGAATTIVRIPPLRSVEVEQNPQDYSAEAVPSHREPLPQVPVSHSVDVIIDRSYRGLSERSASVPPIPQQEYSYYSGALHPLYYNTSPPGATTTAAPSTSSLSPDASTYTPFYMISRSSRHRHHIQSRPRIRRPWSSSSKRVRHETSYWKGASWQKPKFLSVGRTSSIRTVRKPWLSSRSASVIRPAASFYDQSVKFPNNTEMITDIAVPPQNRLDTKGRLETVTRRPSVREINIVSGDSGNFAKDAVNKFNSPRKNFFRNTEDAIYEDILQQEQKVLSERKISRRFPSVEDAIYEDVLSGEKRLLAERNFFYQQPADIDFDDFSTPSTVQQVTITTPPFFVLKTRRRATVLNLPSTAAPPGVFFRRRYRGRGSPPSLSNAPSTTESSPLRMTPPSSSTPLPIAEEDNPLDGAIVEAPLTTSETVRSRIRKTDLRKIAEGKADSLVFFEQPPTVPTVRTHSVATTEWSTQASTQSTPLRRVTSTTATPLPEEISTHPTRLHEETSTHPTLLPVEATSLSASQEAPSHIQPEEESDENSIHPEATIIPTVGNTLWTVPPPPGDDALRIRQLRENNSHPLLVVDKLAERASTATSTAGELGPIFPPEFVGNLIPQRRAKAMAATTLKRSPIEIHSEKQSDGNSPEAVSVLKLPEGTLRMSHCEVYSLCLDEVGRVEQACHASAGRLVPGLPKRRWGACSRRLLADYHAVDAESQSLEESYGSCIRGRLGQNITDVEPTKCAAHSLPTTLANEPCHSKLHVLKYHCTKLSRCCPDAKICRDEVNRTDAARYLRRRKESLALAAAKCQVKTYKEYRFRRLKPVQSHLP